MYNIVGASNAAHVKAAEAQDRAIRMMVLHLRLDHKMKKTDIASRVGIKLREVSDILLDAGEW